jgi:hypothetical protein
MRRRAGLTSAFVSLALLALAPFHVRYSQELRPYSLGLLLLCLSLLCLDRFLERPNLARLASLYLVSLATAYTLYLAAVALAVAGAATVVEDSFSAAGGRRHAARAFLRWSPVWIAALWLGYLPWWPVVMDLARRAPVTAAPPISFDRFARQLSFFAFAPYEGFGLGVPGVLYLALVAAGLWMTLRQKGLRFLIVWALGGFAAIEGLSHLHPHYDAARHLIPAAIALCPLAALPLATLLEKRRWRLVGAISIAAVLVLNARSLLVYFRQGRSDWRVLAETMRREANSSEKIFSENQWTQLCLGFYLRAKESRSPDRPPDWPVWNLDGEIARLTWSWVPGTRAWLVLAGGPRYERLRRWADTFPCFPVPPAEGAMVCRLEPALRDRAFERAPPEPVGRPVAR